MPPKNRRNTPLCCKDNGRGAQGDPSYCRFSIISGVVWRKLKPNGFFVEMGTRQYRLEGKTNTNFRKGLPLREAKVHVKWEVVDVSLSAQLCPANSAFWLEKCLDRIQ